MLFRSAVYVQEGFGDVEEEMRRIKDTEYMNYISWARENSANRVYPCSIAEGFQSGDIYVNEGSDVEAVFFWHYCGFGYITGNASDTFLNEIYSEMISGNTDKRLVLITSDDHVTAFFRNRNVLMDSRAEYFYPHQKGSDFADGGAFRIVQITRENISKIEGRIIPSFSWESSEQFLKEGFGYIALDQKRVCAVAFSAAVSSDDIDIGVETHEDYRRKGLAVLLASRMCEHIISIGKRPVWAHSILNHGSKNTALKCGFVQDRINTVIRKKN